ncbi:cytochrome bd oxidase small subunit CydS [Lysinibacillus sp. NPDC094403]
MNQFIILYAPFLVVAASIVIGFWIGPKDRQMKQ